MRTKRSVVLILGAAILLAVSWFLYAALQPPVLPIGALLPPLPCMVCQGSDTLRAMESRTTLIMLFNTRCPHCLYELDVFDRNYATLSHLRIYLVTTEPEFQLCKEPMRWLNLFTSDQVIWAKVSEANFARYFGTALSPAMFIFDGKGVLKKKIRGEVKVETVIDEFNEY